MSTEVAAAATVIQVQPIRQEYTAVPQPPLVQTASTVPQAWDMEALLNEFRKVGRSIQTDCREEMRKIGRRLQDEVRLVCKDMPRSSGGLDPVPEGVQHTEGVVAAPAPPFMHSASNNIHSARNHFHRPAEARLRKTADHNGDGVMDVLDLEFDAVLKQHVPTLQNMGTTEEGEMHNIATILKHGPQAPVANNGVPVQAWGGSTTPAGRTTTPAGRTATPSGRTVTIAESVSPVVASTRVAWQDEQPGGKGNVEEICGTPRSKEDKEESLKDGQSGGGRGRRGRHDTLTSADIEVVKSHSTWTNVNSRGRSTRLVGELSAGGNRLSIGREFAKAEQNKRRKAQRKTVRNLTWYEIRQMNLRDLIQSVAFDNIVGTVILMNAAVIGFQTDYNARNMTDDVPVVYFIFEQFFCVWFTVELTLRVWVYRCKFFYWRKEGWVWNYFDTFVVIAQLLEVFFHFIERSTSIDVKKIRLLRIMRVLRLLRILRVVRVLHLISELREILASIAGSFKSLLWVVVLLALQIFIVAVYFTQSVTDHMVEQSERVNWAANEEEAFLRSYFGSIARSILTLWQAMSGGLDWDVLAGPLLKEISFITGFAFACFVAFSLLALMNVVTGVFVQTALASAHHEEEAFMTAQIVALFRIANKDQVLTLEGITETLDDPETKQIWSNVGVQAEDAKFLFKLLDLDNSGEIKFEEFLGGCLRLNGNAKAIDILTVMQEQRKTSDMFGFKLVELENACVHIIKLLTPNGYPHYPSIMASAAQGGSGGGGGAGEVIVLRQIQEDMSHLLDQGNDSRQELRTLTQQLLGPLRWLEGLMTGPEPPIIAGVSNGSPPKRPGTSYSNGSWV